MIYLFCFRYVFAVSEGILLSTLCVLLFSVVEGIRSASAHSLFVFEFMSGMLVCDEFHSKSIIVVFMFIILFNPVSLHCCIFYGFCNELCHFILYLPHMFYTFAVFKIFVQCLETVF